MLKIAIDAGHGLNTPGKEVPSFMGYGKIKEWALNDKITRELIDMLKDYSNVETLRTDDPTGKTDVALSKRTKVANEWGADLFISNHHNAGINGKKGGGLVVIRYPFSTLFTRQMQKDLYDSIIAETGLKGNRTSPLVERGNLAVLRQTNMASVLIEHGFMDSPSDMKVIMQEDFAEKSAKGIVNWLEKHYGLEKKEQDYPKKKITQESSKKEILWAQRKLNAILPDWMPRIEEDGIYGPKTRIAVLVYWEQLGWGRHMRDTGMGIGKATRKALAAGRRE